MKVNWKDETKEQIIALTVSGFIIASLCFLYMNWGHVAGFFAKAWRSLAVFWWGLGFTFVLLPVRRLVENKWLKDSAMDARKKRKISVLFCIVFLILVLVAFFAVLIPQLSSSVSTLAASLDGYQETIAQFFAKTGTESDPELVTAFANLSQSLADTIESWVSSTDGLVSTVVSYGVTFVKGVFNFFVGIIVAVYLLLDSERWKRQIKKVVYAMFPEPAADRIRYVAHLTGDMLDSFIFGKALDSIIVGVACAIVCAIMKMPYTPLIAFVIGLTNMIPVFGPFIGAIPCIFILLIISPFKALEFAIFILILQQIDGNILGPYILGDSLGLPALWVMFAIILGGAMFGVLGMFLGVPIFSVIYVLIRDRSNLILRNKRLKI